MATQTWRVVVLAAVLAVLAVVVGAESVRVIGQSFRSVSEPQLTTQEIEVVRNLLEAPIDVEIVAGELKSLENNWYDLELDLKHDAPFLTYKVYNTMGGAMQVSLDFFEDSRVRAIWGPSTNLQGTYEARISERELRLILGLLVRSGAMEPSDLLREAQLPVPPDSAKFQVTLHAESLAIKGSTSTEVRHTPYIKTMTTPSVECNAARTSLHGKMTCNLHMLHNTLFAVAVRLARPD